MAKITEKRKELNDYLAQYPDDRLTSFKCNACHADIGTLKPSPGNDDFTSSVSCPDCENIMFKIVSSDGKVNLLTAAN